MSQPPLGQGPIDPHGAFSPPPAPGSPPPFMPPPPGYYPPPMMPMMMMPPPPAPPAKGKSFARAIFMTLATTIFGISLLLNMYLLMISGIMQAGEASRETVIEKGDPNHRVVVLTVDGIINDAAANAFRKQLKTLENDKTLAAIVVEVDSPGGSVTASDEIYHEIMTFKAKYQKKVVILQGSLAASGGYYISCAGDYIVAQPTTLTGNIGVLLQRFNVSKMLDKWGVEETTLKSAGSPYKNAESMFKPETAEANAYLQTIVDEAYGQFSDVVKAGRQASLKGNVKDIANGKVYTAKQALDLGLVDEINYREAAYAKAVALASLGGVQPTIVRLKSPPSLMDLLTSKTSVGTGASGNVEFNGIKVDAGSVRDLMTPRVMYLWDGQ